MKHFQVSSFLAAATTHKDQQQKLTSGNSDQQH